MLLLGQNKEMSTGILLGTIKIKNYIMNNCYFGTQEAREREGSELPFVHVSSNPTSRQLSGPTWIIREMHSSSDSILNYVNSKCRLHGTEEICNAVFLSPGKCAKFTGGRANWRNYQIKTGGCRCSVGHLWYKYARQPVYGRACGFTGKCRLALLELINFSQDSGSITSLI